MYRALYDYKSKLPQYLSFLGGDKFTVLDGSRSDWLYAQNGIGQLGYIPNNYVIKIDAPVSQIMKFIDGSIEAIHLQAASNGGSYSHKEREVLRKLIHHRSVVSDGNRQSRVKKSSSTPDARASSARRKAPPPPRENSIDVAGTTAQEKNDKPASSKRNPAPAPPRENSVLLEPEAVDGVVSGQEETSSNGTIAMETSPVKVDIATSPVKNLRSPEFSAEIDVKALCVPNNLGSELLEQVRTNTGLSYDKSRVAVETVLGYIGFKVPKLAATMDKVFSTLSKEADQIQEVGSRDASRLEVIFSELTSCKDDSQQRSWALHEDESIIKEYLQELLSILENAKPSICRKAIAQDNYENVHNLVQYYQMETRLSIRLLLLKVFGAMSGLDKVAITMLLFSVLPLELGEDIQSKSDDVTRLCYVSLVMAMLFSTGEHVPANIHDHLNQSFIAHVLDLIETPPSMEHDEQATDMLITLILAFNLHFEDVNHNIVIQSLSEQQNAKTLTEKLMLLFNRGDDPVRMFEHLPEPPHSVIKFMQDLYSFPGTANLLYTNDAMVLIDIIIRQLANLSAGDLTRTSYLVLTKLVLKNSNYKEFYHRQEELFYILRSIADEEADVPEDKELCTLILLENDQTLSPT
ncbi:NCK-interacting protein with SH3 domain-like [Haliotis cracherodii]|uniref:NCK-interacting protein with SH3 domain-like n=1 Tax=Haliotis cracherodii TaxID=6455 RepID=UPI0039E93074